MADIRKGLILCLCGALGAGAAVGASACGDDERGGVEVEGATTGAAATGTTGAGTTATSPAGTETVGTETTETIGTETAETTGTETAPSP